MRIDSQVMTDVRATGTGASRGDVASRQARSVPGAEEPPRQTPAYEVGFGENTVSTGVVALVAIDTNLRNAREVVPSIEEVIGEVRDRIEALAEESVFPVPRAEVKAGVGRPETRADSDGESGTQPVQYLGNGAPEESYRPVGAQLNVTA